MLTKTLLISLYLLSSTFVLTFDKARRQPFHRHQKKSQNQKLSDRLIQTVNRNLSHNHNGLNEHQRKLGLLNSMHFLEKSAPGEDDDKVLFQGWGSFFVVESSQKIAVGSKFYENIEFKEQQKRGEDSADTDQYGPKNIPSEKSFWILQNHKGVYMLSSRKDAITKFKHFLPFNALKEGSSAIQELGQFDEGFCLQINSVGETCILCFSSSNMLSIFFSMFKSLQGSTSMKGVDQIDFQAQLSKHESEIIEDYPKLNAWGAQISGIIGAKVSLNKDSVWKLLQDWSTCSKACGGGVSTRQLICVKGTEGKPCQGKSVQEKPCNLQPCTPIPKAEKNTEILPMIVRSQSASKRPQREEPCVIKEGDMELVRDDLKGFVKPPRTPARVILNNATLSIFLTDNFGDIVFSVTLKELQFFDDPKDKNCLKLQNKRNNDWKRVCAMEFSRESMADQIESWRKYIKMFRDKCPGELIAQRVREVENDPVVLRKKQGLDNTKKALAQEAQVQSEDPTKDILDGFKNIEGNLVGALNKEMKFEQLVEQEELEKQRKQEKTREDKIETLKQNEECNQRETEKEDQVERQSLEKNGVEEQINSLKESVKDMILSQRTKENNKINVLRKMKDKQKRKDEQQMTEIRTKIAKQLKKEFQKGDGKACKPDASMDEMRSICDKYYADSGAYYDKCLKPDNFCTYCCVGEFGREYKKEKMGCLNKCLENNKSYIWDKQTPEQVAGQ